ncbi:hypothetical protein QTP88_016027 [Uroleucon formosanum]
MHINISPLSEINFLKADIKEIGYEHILSFRRQIYIKHEDIPKLPGSILININETNFRIFFTDDPITCYTCKSTGHISMTCNKNTINSQNISQTSNHQDNQIHQPTSSEEEQSSERLENIQIPESPTFIEEVPKTHTEWTVETPTPPLKIPAPTNSESIQQHIITIESPSISPSTNNQDVNILNTCIQEQNKRSLSDTTSQKSPSSPKSDQQPIKKKPKVLPDPNSSTKPEGKNLDSILQSTSSHIKDYNGYFKNRVNPGRASGGVAIFIKDNIERDFNSRNTIWGSSYTDNRGKIMGRLLERSDLILLNNGKPTRHNPVNGKFSAIDLSIASPSIAPDLEWDTLTSYNGSDHWPILLKLFSLTP